MIDAKMTVFLAQVFDNAEMPHQTLNHCDIGGKQDTYISNSYPIYKKDDAEVRHLNTIKQLSQKTHHFCGTEASRDFLSLRWMRQREKKSRRAPGQRFQKNISHYHRRNSR